MSGAIPAVACRCCPSGISRSTRVPWYPSDMSDAEWAVIEPTLPRPAWKQGQGGRPAGHCRRDLIDAIRYLVKEGICWRAMPADSRPGRPSTTHRQAGRTAVQPRPCTANCAASAASRPGRKPGPSAAVIDSQSVKAAEEVTRACRGYDAGKLVTWAKTALKLTVEITKRPDDLHTFKVLPRRWVVERTLAWITRHRRTVRDYERLTGALADADTFTSARPNAGRDAGNRRSRW
jgi:transposase